VKKIITFVGATIIKMKRTFRIPLAVLAMTGIFSLFILPAVFAIIGILPLFTFPSLKRQENVIVGPVDSLPTLPKLEDIPQNYKISLQVGDIDTRKTEPVLPKELYIEKYPISELGYYIIQFKDVILPEWSQKVSDTGAIMIGYMPNNAFLVKMTEAQKSKARGITEIQWIGIFQPAYKISTSFKPPHNGTSIITILTFPHVDLDNVKSRLISLGGKIDSVSDNKETGGHIRLVIDLTHLANIARINNVMWIEPWIEPRLNVPAVER